MKLFYSLFQLLFPPKCVLCGKLLEGEETDLCHSCRQDTPGILNDAGINVMLTADTGSQTAHLPMHIGFCIARGLKEKDAFEGVTIRAAKLLGIDDKVGSIEVGKDADLAIFDGFPFSNLTLCKMTMIDGVVYKNEL